MTIANNDENFACVVICAVRYAIGRKTYITGSVVDFVYLLVKRLDSRTLAVIAKDIKSARDENRLGDEIIDAPLWIRLLDACMDELKNRSDEPQATPKKRHYTNRIGERVRYAREQKGITQRSLAMQCGLGFQSCISKIERGEVYPNQDTLDKLSRELGVSMSWLVNGEETV